jgi:hypothetical protein
VHRPPRERSSHYSRCALRFVKDLVFNIVCEQTERSRDALHGGDVGCSCADVRTTDLSSNISSIISNRAPNSDTGRASAARSLADFRCHNINNPGS